MAWHKVLNVGDIIIVILRARVTDENVVFRNFKPEWMNTGISHDNTILEHSSRVMYHCIIYY